MTDTKPWADARSRRFVDDAGRAWQVRIFAPATAPALLSAAHARGWLTFECEDGERRRLVPAPDDWDTLADDALAIALASARPVARADAMRLLLRERQWSEPDEG